MIVTSQNTLKKVALLMHKSITTLKRSGLKGFLREAIRYVLWKLEEQQPVQKEQGIGVGINEAPLPQQENVNIPTPPKPTVLDKYITSAPHPQNMLDIFKGEWLSRLSEPFADLQAGAIPLFQDHRIDIGMRNFGGVANKTVLELGPLEGGHTYMLEQMGASSILAIEANTHAYMRCLIVKELYALQKSSFLCGDFIEYLRHSQTTFDICIASGVLYHMSNPVELIALIAKTCESVLIWTHYYDYEILAGIPSLLAHFRSTIPIEYEGFTCTLYCQQYDEALTSNCFCGGTKTYSHWMRREDILRCLHHFGFGDIDIFLENAQHQHGPSFTLTAKKESSLS